MKLTRRNIIGALSTLTLSIVFSYVVIFLMFSHSGTNDYMRMAPAILLFALALPLAGGFYLRSLWPLASLAFSWTLILLLLSQAGSDAPSKIVNTLAPLAGIAISIIAARIGSRIAARQNQAP